MERITNKQHVYLYRARWCVARYTRRTSAKPSCGKLAEGGGATAQRSSSRLSSNPLQISPTSNPITHLNTKHPRDPPQPSRQDHAEINPPPGLLQPIKHPRRQRLLRLSVRIVYLKRWVNARDRVRDGTKARRETVFVKTVAQPGPRVRDPPRVLDVVNSALEGDGLQR